MTEDTGTVFSVIKVGPGEGTPLSSQARAQVIRVTAQTHLHLPGMFEITFLDDLGDVTTEAGLSIGTEVRIFAPSGETGAPKPLLAGEVTSIEGVYEQLTNLTVVRGYDKAHRLQRARRTRTFLNMTDSDIASQLATEAGLATGQIDASATIHEHLGQCDQTDWEFLTQRAREIGFEAGVSDRALYFRKASTTAGATEPPTLTFGQQLWSFRPRVSAGNLTSEVEVRVWDPAKAAAVSARAAAAPGSAGLGDAEPAAMGAKFAGADAAYVVTDRPAATGAAIDDAAAVLAAGLAAHVGSTFAEAEGDAAGDPSIQAGAAIDVRGVPGAFIGSWLVTSARHIFDVRETGYHTTFEAAGRQDRSLLGLASAASARPAPPRIPGLACGVVTNNNDPQRLGRVKAALGWLSPDYETNWAPVVQFGAGKRSGAMFLPEAGDQVLVGFEFGDPRRPYVLGGLPSSASSYDLGGPAVQASGMSGEIVRRGFVSAAGNRLVFHDEMPPEGQPTASAITLGTGDGSLALAIDQTAGTITIACRPAPPGSQAAAGQLTIQCGDAGIVNIATGPGGSVNIDGGDALSLKAQASISIECSGPVAIKGSQIMLN